MANSYLGAIGKFVRREVNLAKGTFPDQPPQSIVSYSSEILGRKLSVQRKTETLANMPGNRK